MDDLGPTYAEVRQWIVWLRLFTPSDLADSMAVHPAVAEKFIKAALWHGIIQDTEDHVNGFGVPERIYSYVEPRRIVVNYPLYRWTEWQNTPGVNDLARLYAPNRGLPVRIRSDRDTRRLMGQGSGGARHRMVQAEKRYQAHLAAVEKRKATQRSKAQKQPKWKRNAKKRSVIV